MYHWHGEGFELPSGAELLAEGSDFPIEAFQFDNAFGFQFHPDVTYAMMHRWTTRGHARLELPGARARHHHFADRAVHDVSRARLAETVHRRMAGPRAVAGDVGSGGVAGRPRPVSGDAFSNLQMCYDDRKIAASGGGKGGEMTGDQFALLLNEFTLSAESGDGARFASHFTQDAIYYDYIYGPHHGRAEIAHMMQELFHRDAAEYRWEMFDPVFDGVRDTHGRYRASRRRSRNSKAKRW